MENQSAQRNRKFKVVLLMMLLIFIGFLLTGFKDNLTQSYATMCSFLITAAGFFFGANVWEKLGVIKSQK